jgi:hypothetical protein
MNKSRTSNMFSYTRAVGRLKSETSYPILRRVSAPCAGMALKLTTN